MESSILRSLRAYSVPIAMALLVSACGGSGGGTSDDSVTNPPSANESVPVEDAVEMTAPLAPESVETDADVLSEPAPASDVEDAVVQVTENNDSVPPTFTTPEIEDTPPANNTDLPLSDEPLTPAPEQPAEQSEEQAAEQQPEIINTVQPALNLVAAATPPQIDANSQVSWSFAPITFSLSLEIMPFVEMPVSYTHLTLPTILLV